MRSIVWITFLAACVTTLSMVLREAEERELIAMNPARPITERVNQVSDNAISQVKQQAGSALEQAKQHSRRIEQNSSIDENAKSWVEMTLDQANDLVAQQALPVLQKTVEKVPASADWAIGQLERKVATTTGPAKDGWEAALEKMKKSSGGSEPKKPAQ